MGYFGWLFRGASQPPTLSQICREIAYDLLPHHVFGPFDSFRVDCLLPEGAARFYRDACRAQGLSARDSVAKELIWQHGTLGDGVEYMALRYPSPPELGLSQLSPEQLRHVVETGTVVLAPYFSVVVFDRPRDRSRYCVLEQSALGQGARLREVLPDKILTLGVVPTPLLDDLLKALARRQV